MKLLIMNIFSCSCYFPSLTSKCSDCFLIEKLEGRKQGGMKAEDEGRYRKRYDEEGKQRVSLIFC
jgi:hypothetical protein